MRRMNSADAEISRRFPSAIIVANVDGSTSASLDTAGHASPMTSGSWNTSGRSTTAWLSALTAIREMASQTSSDLSEASAVHTWYSTAAGSAGWHFARAFCHT